MGQSFPVEFAPQYLTFKVSFIKFSNELSMEEHTTHYHEQFGGCLIKIYLVFNILQSLEHNIGLPSVFLLGVFFPVNLPLNFFLSKFLTESFQLNYLWMTILHITMNNLIVVL